jgi:hypothetical protein
MGLAEIAETVTVDFDMDDGPQHIPAHRYWNQRDVLEKCAGLITESEGMIQVDNIRTFYSRIKQDRSSWPTSPSRSIFFPSTYLRESRRTSI